jgi:hypothetical protein
MFKFNFGQVLDYPIDHDEMEEGGLEGHSMGGDSEMQIGNEIVIDVPQEAENGKKTTQDQCGDVPLDDLVSVYSYNKYLKNIHVALNSVMLLTTDKDATISHIIHAFNNQTNQRERNW